MLCSEDWGITMIATACNIRKYLHNIQGIHPQTCTSELLRCQVPVRRRISARQSGSSSSSTTKPSTSSSESLLLGRRRLAPAPAPDPAPARCAAGLLPPPCCCLPGSAPAGRLGDAAAVLAAASGLAPGAADFPSAAKILAAAAFSRSPGARLGAEAPFPVAPAPLLDDLHVALEIPGADSAPFAARSAVVPGFAPCDAFAPPPAAALPGADSLPALPATGFFAGGRGA